MSKQTIAVLDRDKCVAGKKCSYECINFNPGVRMGKETVVKGEDGYPEFDEEDCIGCEISAKKCPFDAVDIVNKPQELDRPVHQYGKNSFRLYRLPVPLEESVVGIIGPNGIGKTTALKVLSGEITPNLGELEKTVDLKEAIQYYRGKEIQKHLEELKEKDVKVAIKPQTVNKLPKMFEGKVKELLEKTEQKNNLKEVIQKLELEEILERDLGSVSGGELQKIAIAATLIKEADLYCFDEPTSFLDVKQRLKVARVIRELAENNKVIVVEHDLGVVDYLSDYTQVVYGKKGTYGVFSNVKSSREGINQFLEGYLTDENIRFRKESITFETRPPSKPVKSKEKTDYPEFTKKYPGFQLDVEEGELRNGEVIGILGPNAIGKTTFIKVLAGEEDPDIKLDKKISYKPQYLKMKSKKTVKQLVNSQEILEQVFDLRIKKFIEDLYEKNINNLSGGELQRVAIALALARPSDVCLLDEPSAFLDVERRVEASKLIRKVSTDREITTLVVDHDITLVDHVSDRLMIFEGKPGTKGKARSPVPMEKGMNKFLEKMDITFRRDPQTGRPRANKPGSRKDREQKKNRNYFYASN